VVKRKIGVMLLGVAAIVLLNFFLPRFLPGDPLSAILNAASDTSVVNEEAINHLKAYYHLDKSLVEQFRLYVSGMFSGDLGYSYYLKQPVTDLIAAHFPWTLLLTISSLIVAVIVGVVLGMISVANRTKPVGAFLLTLMSVFRAVPTFFLGEVLLLLIGYRLGWLPISGAVTTGLEGSFPTRALDIAAHSLLPILTLAIIQIPGMFLMTHNALLDVIKEQYITVAKLKGLPTWKTYTFHALPNIMAPLITLIGMRFGFTAAGAVIIETVFAYPGMGNLMNTAINVRDFPMLQAGFMLISVYVLVVNMCADLIAVWVNPRTRHSRSFKVA
jgi:peptide/nickel transport system permease protein